jgi:hypothetical protein
MILIEARVNVAEAKKQIAGICNSYERSGQAKTGRSFSAVWKISHFM